jgi:DNA-binding transcriptional regulator/RsmH inhibitor MraZ
MKTASINTATLYSGSSQHAIDDSNRIMIPSDWRGADAPERFFVLLSPAAGDHLVICPPAVFEASLEKLRASGKEEQVPEMEREVNQWIRQVSLDKVGRLPLPREFTTKAGIEKQADLIGRFSKFEVWPYGKDQSARAAGEEARATVTRILQNI